MKCVIKTESSIDDWKLKSLTGAPTQAQTERLIKEKFRLCCCTLFYIFFIIALFYKFPQKFDFFFLINLKTFLYFTILTFYSINFLVFMTLELKKLSIRKCKKLLVYSYTPCWMRCKLVNDAKRVENLFWMFFFFAYIEAFRPPLFHHSQNFSSRRDNNFFNYVLLLALTFLIFQILVMLFMKRKHRVCMKKCKQ